MIHTLKSLMGTDLLFFFFLARVLSFVSRLENPERASELLQS